MPPGDTIDADGERPVDVRTPLGAIEPHLRGGGADAFHGSSVDRQSQATTRHACNLIRLVESPLEQPRAVQGHGHQGVDAVFRRRFAHTVRQQLAEDPRVRERTFVLEALHQSRDRELVIEGSEAQLIDARAEAAGQVGRTRRAEVVPAGPAWPLAQQAAGWQQVARECIEAVVNPGWHRRLTASGSIPILRAGALSRLRRLARQTQNRCRFQELQMTQSLDLAGLGGVRADWTLGEARAIHDAPFGDLLFHAQRVHRAHFAPNRVQVSTLLSVKTGACPEDCKYCPQSVRYDTGLEREELLQVEQVVAAAQAAQASGATRFCMGAAYRSPKPKQLEQIKQMVRAVRALGLETCATAGMLTPSQARELKDAGLDYYNHNLDTSAEFYGEIVTTRTYQERLDTLQAVRDAGLNVCCGGILGMGESTRDRVALLHTLATLPQHPESVPINQLVQVPGTPLHGLPPLDPLDLVRVIATARLLMPRSYVRLSAGRTDMDDAVQALCFQAGANSIFYGERLLTTPNPGRSHDQQLFARLGLEPETSAAPATTA